jgi:predicted phage terminase large subunit-like protein
MRKTSLHEYDRRAEMLIQQIRSEVRPFEDNSAEAKQRRLQQTETDILWAMKTYFPHHFPDRWSGKHKSLLDVLDINNELVQILAFRGFGKTTFFSIYALLKMLQKKRRFVLFLSDTVDQAELVYSLTIRTEIENNLRLREDFGDQRSKHWESEEFILKCGCMGKCLGRMSKIRSRKYIQYRPDLAIIDEWENDKNVKNPRYVKEGVDILMDQLVPAMGDDFQIYFLGTVIAKKCAATELKKNENIRTIEIPAETADGKPTWPGVFNKRRLKNIKRVIGTVKYLKEYMLDVRSEVSLFDDKWFKYFNLRTLDLKKLHIISYIDPSVKQKEQHDYKAIVTVGKPFEGYPYFYVLHTWIKHASTMEMIYATYSIYEYFRQQGGIIAQIGLEAVGAFELLLPEFERMGKEKGYILPVRGYPQTVNKEVRIGRLSPMFERGQILLQDGQIDLIEQLIAFPSSVVKDDGPDALEGAVRLLEHGFDSEIKEIEIM